MNQKKLEEIRKRKDDYLKPVYAPYATMDVNDLLNEIDRLRTALGNIIFSSALMFSVLNEVLEKGGDWEETFKACSKSLSRDLTKARDLLKGDE